VAALGRSFKLCRRWREQVTRSALTLKLLTSHSHGSIAAGATFALPKASGAGHNWDYRAPWLRDASFTIYAFMRLGYIDEAERFRRWVSDRARGAVGGELRIMYALDGAETPDEPELDHLSGYGDAKARAHRQRRAQATPARRLRGVDGQHLPRE
jgi:GH15 family glucan-1,4-alpha-glucosidase